MGFQQTDSLDRSDILVLCRVRLYTLGLILMAQRGYRAVKTLFEKADALILGVGSVDGDAPIFIDGFVTTDELATLQAQGAVGLEGAV